MIKREEFTWGTGYGQVKTADEIDDDHLQNIDIHISVRYPHAYSAELRTFIKEELARRNLKPKTTELPHRDPGGGWAMWDTELLEIGMIGREAALDALTKFFRSTTRYRIVSVG